MDVKLLKYLEDKKINYETFHHKAVFTVEESKNLKQKIPGKHCKTLFLKDESRRFYLIALPTQKRLDIKKLQKNLKVKKLNFALESDLKDKINSTPGSVSIFAAIYSTDITLILDSEIWNAEKTGFHPNINTSTLVITHENLEKFCNSLNIEKKILDL